MSGIKTAFIVAIFSITAHADPSGSGHVHSTSVGDGSSAILSSSGQQAPPSIAQTNSYSQSNSDSGSQSSGVAMTQPGKVKGNGLGVRSLEDRLGVPDGESPQDAVSLVVPRSIPYGE